MHQALRSSLVILIIVACAGCMTHDRRIYSMRQDKNLHTPDPWAPSTTKAADEATSALGGDTDADNGPVPGVTAPAEQPGLQPGQ
jgi:hypothetical protein